MSEYSDYKFDFKKMVDFFNYSDKCQSKELEILDNYEISDEQKLETVGKTIRELTTAGNAQIDNIKYDLLKTFVLQVINYTGSDDEMPVGTQICFNTLIMEKMLVSKYGN